MKKVILLVLCFIFIFSGCERLEKAEPYYTESREDVTFSTQYKYYFADEEAAKCSWVNNSDEEFSFHDTFELHILGDDGEWYVVSKGDEVTFNTNYSHGVDGKSETYSRYDFGLYTDTLKNGETYRISTYYFDEDGNYYQVFAEFTCDDKLAEEEMKEVSGTSRRENPEESDNIFEGK